LAYRRLTASCFPRVEIPLQTKSDESGQPKSLFPHAKHNGLPWQQAIALRQQRLTKELGPSEFTKNSGTVPEFFQNRESLCFYWTYVMRLTWG
jgi:hypothetical protein